MLTLRRPHALVSTVWFRPREWPRVALATLLEGVAMGLLLSVLLACALNAQTGDVALVLRAPAVDGEIEGSLQQLRPESIALGGGAIITGDLLVPGTPTVRVTGQARHEGIREGTGAVSPSGYRVSLGGRAALRHIILRTEPVTLPTVPAPAAATGSRAVSLKFAGETPGDFATLRDLMLAPRFGLQEVPPGHYGEFSAQADSGFVIGVANSPRPVAYHFERLTLHDRSQLRVIGPVVVTVANQVALKGSVGEALHPEWLALQVYGDGATLHHDCAVHGYLVAPAGSVVLHGRSQLVGGVVAGDLAVHANATLRLRARTAPNTPPTVAITAPADGASFLQPAGFLLAAAATDPDGTIARVEFFQGTVKLGEATVAPYQWPVAGLSAGSHVFFARALDDRGGSSDSAPIAVAVKVPNNVPPEVALVTPPAGTAYYAPATIHLSAAASDPDGLVTRVEYFGGAIMPTKIGEATVAPFAFAWTGVAPGTYTLTARAVDNAGANTLSAPRAVSVIATLPYFTGFESTEGFALGPLLGQGAWDAAADAVVSDLSRFGGTQAVSLPGSATPLRATQVFGPTAVASVVFVDVFVKGAAAGMPEAGLLLCTETARVACVQSGGLGELWLLRGEGVGGGSWAATGFKVPLAVNGQMADWLRLTLRLDLVRQAWDLFADGGLVAIDAPFAGNAAGGLGYLALQGGAAAAWFDDVYAGFEHPLYADADKDGLEDARELAAGLDPALDDRDGDRDADGLSNIREFLLGTNPAASDTDADGMPDGWEVRHGLNATASSPANDADGDGVSDLREFQLGRNPGAGAVPDTAGSVQLRLFNPVR